jgi:SAM-dependent methyltransferase
MVDYDRLLAESLTGENPYEAKLKKRFEYADLYTFVENKITPVYNWFYYKEGYSKDFVTKTLSELRTPPGSLVVDPFCGTGTTLLSAKEAGYDSAGFDILPLGVFVSRVKLEDYSLPELTEAVKMIASMRYRPPKTKLVDVRFIDMRKAYTPYARNDIAFYREEIMGIQDEKIRNFLMLGLISIVSQASNVMKDGGVLRIVRKRHTPPVKHLLRTKLKRMLKDVQDRGPNPDVSWSANVGDARSLPLEDASADAVITSPPYLNFVDYTKVYALELSLLVSSTKDMEDMRKKSMRSHIGAEYGEDGERGEMAHILNRVTKIDEKDKIPIIVEGYLKDLRLSLKETARILKPQGHAAYVVGNASLPSITVDVDLILAEMAEDLGMEAEEIWVGNVRWADVHDIKKERPARESAVILRKL